MMKNGTKIDCKNCRFLSDETNGAGFFVRVPLYLKKSSSKHEITLQCMISESCHNVTLKEYYQDNDHIEPIPDTIQNLLHDPLTVIAEQKVCGNARVCPKQVVEIVAGKQEA